MVLTKQAYDGNTSSGFLTQQSTLLLSNLVTKGKEPGWWALTIQTLLPTVYSPLNPCN